MKGEFPEAELEARLTRALAKLPDAPVPSNFTARVMQAVDLEEARSARRWKWIFNRRWFLPRVAIAGAVVLFAGLSLHHYELNARRSALAKNVALVAETPMPSVDALKNFDAIRRMSKPAHADDELLALLQ